MAEIEWLLFISQLPATPSSLRVNVWRRLRDAGSASLQNGVWILPRTAENTAFMERLLAYIKQNGAGGQTFLVEGLNQAVREDILKRFEADRDEEYEEFLEQCQGFISEIQKETEARKFTFAELEENEQNLQRLRKWMAKIQNRDFFKTRKSQEAITAFQSCHQALQTYIHRVYSREGIDSLPNMDLLPDDPTHSVLEENDESE